MSRLRREMSANKLPKIKSKMDNLLSAVNREEFAQMIWAVWGLQKSSEPIEYAKQLISHPQDAAAYYLSGKWGVYPWELETLLNLLALNDPDHNYRSISCNKFDIIATFANLLRKLEDAESGIYLNSQNIFREMHRLGHRQFHWQRGFVNIPDFYRNLYLYGVGNCASFFESKNGLSIKSFTKSGFALFALFNNKPLAMKPLDFRLIDIDILTAERAADLMTVPVRSMRSELNQMIAGSRAERQPTAYRPSFLRQKPIISFGSYGERLRAPLPPLIMHRMSSGLYYDLQSAGTPIRAEIGKKFETYCRDFIAALMPKIHTISEYRYQKQNVGNQIDSPDILLIDSNNLVAAIECKATKLTFKAQFSDDPASEAAYKYDEIAKGVYQLWRFFAHCRMGLTPHNVSQSTHAVVLTLDSWLTMSNELRNHVLEKARAKAALDADITDEDQFPIVFSAIQDFERFLALSDEEGFLKVLAATKEEKFNGWLLPYILRELNLELEEIKPYPFNINDGVEWWDEIEQLKGRHAP